MKFSNKLMVIMILLMAFALTSCPEDENKGEGEEIEDEMTATIDITTSSSTVTETVDFDASDNIAIDGGVISGTSGSFTIVIHTDDAEVFFFSAESSSIALAGGTAVAGSNEDEHEYTGSFTFSSEGQSATFTCTDGIYTLGK